MSCCKKFNLYCCNFFYRLKSIDLVCMKKLDTKVNVIPIIAKADTISKSELQKFKVNYFYFNISNATVVNFSMMV